MGLYDYPCMISGISLRASKAVLLVLEPTLNGPVPAALPIKGTYNRAGYIDMFREDDNCKRILDCVTRKIEDGELYCDEEYFPFSDTEQFLECLTAWGNQSIRFSDERGVRFALICRTIWDAIVKAASTSTEDVESLFRRVFRGSTIAPEIYGDDIASFEKSLRELAAVTDFLASRGMAWTVTEENSAGQHYEDVGTFLAAARETFSDSPMMLEALDEYERGFRKSMQEPDSYLGPQRDGFVLDDGTDGQQESDDALEDNDDEDNDDEDNDDEDNDDEDFEDDEPTAYEDQEFIFYLGDRCLGSFLMPVDGTATSEPITRRLITAPTKTDMCGSIMLLWVEETDDGATTMIWNADTPKEMIEATRLCAAARGLDGSDDEPDEDFVPVDRSPEEQLLLRAIREDPESDAPLLQYADWLTSQGNPQGEFIRVDLEVARTDSNDPRYEELNERWAALLDEHGEAWFEQLTSLRLFPYERSFWIDRGVIGTVEINRPNLLLRRADELFDAAPLLRTLAFDCEPFNVGELASIPQLSQITRLELGHLDVEPGELVTLLNSPHLLRLTDLELNGNESGSEMVEAVVNSPVWSRLRSLDLSSCGLEDDVVDVIAEGIAPVALQKLDLDGNSLSSAALESLGRAIHLKNLKILNLGGTALTAEGVAAVAKAPWIPELQELSLKACEIDEEIAAELSAWPVKSLKKLDLDSCNVSDSALRKLLETKFLSKVEELELDSNNLSNDGIQSLVQSPQVANLTLLDLSRNPFGDDGVSAIANSSFLTKLSTLRIHDVEFGSAGVESLVKCLHLNQIASLWVPDTINDADYQRLALRFGDGVSML